MLAMPRDGGASPAGASIGGGQQRADIAQRLLCLRADVPGMRRLKADDARGARDEQRLRGTALDAAARKGRALRAVLSRIVPGAALARILERDRRARAGDAVDRE